MSLHSSFAFSDEAQMLRQSAEDLVAALPQTTSTKYRTGSGFDPELWAEMAELGWHGIAISPDFGGSGLGNREVMVLNEQMGRGLVKEPFLMSSIVCAGILEQGGTTGLLESVCDGSTILALAAQEGRGAPEDMPATRIEDDRLMGEKRLVIGGENATHLIVTAMSGQDLALVLVPTDAAGIERQGYWSVDDRRLADITFTGTRLDSNAIIARGADAQAMLDSAIQTARAGLCAEAVGAIDKAIELCRDYLNTRKQFGQPLASFQALAHRSAEMLLEAEMARAMALLATVTLESRSGDAEPIKRAKARVSKAGLWVGEQSIQLHGGMGMTDEMLIGRYFKRLLFIEGMFGAADVLNGELTAEMTDTLRK